MSKKSLITLIICKKKHTNKFTLKWLPNGQTCQPYRFSRDSPEFLPLSRVPRPCLKIPGSKGKISGSFHQGLAGLIKGNIWMYVKRCTIITMQANDLYFVGVNYSWSCILCVKARPAALLKIFLNYKLAAKNIFQIKQRHSSLRKWCGSAKSGAAYRADGNGIMERNHRRVKSMAEIGSEPLLQSRLSSG